ncbi:MAG: hypothetical protein MUF77_14235 [Leptospira sp.]|jgi:hypothetical protein|nr:hypothetical protein [Leptospira sp.]
MKLINITFLLHILFLSSSSCKNNIGFQKSDPENVIKELQSRKYEYSKYLNFRKEVVEEIVVKESTIYKEGDIDLICELRMLRELKFSKAKIANFSSAQSGKCQNSQISRVRVSNSNLNNLQICNFVKLLKSEMLSIEFYNSKFDGLDLECFSDLSNLDTLALDRVDLINDKQFCNFSKKSKKLTFLRLNDSPLTNKSLDCMLELPSLKEVMLQRWKNVSEDEMQDWVTKYERKYNRKLEAQIIDPIGYER